MRWHVVVLVACLPLMAMQVAHTQERTPVPDCQRACRVNPFTAPASCDCTAPGGPATRAPEPAAPAPRTPAPVPAPAPTEPSLPASAAPAVPSCERACQVNPFTAPAECACRTGVQRGSAAPVPSSAAPASSSGIFEDGVITVREVLDYMDALYRERIAGITQYYFLERIEYAQAAASAARASGGFVLTSAAPAQSPALAAASPVPFTALRTREKVTVDGHPVMKDLTPEERRRQQQQATQASGKGADTGQQLLEDPSLFFGALAKAAEAFLGGAAASPFLAMQEELRSAGGGAPAAGEDPFAEDVLAELERLRQAEAAEGSDREMYLGYYARGGQTFRLGPRCADTGCTASDYESFRRTVFKVEPLEGQAGAASVQILYNYIFCIVWRPGAASLEAFDVPGQPLTAQGAELWLPIPDYRSPAEGPGSASDPLRGEHHDRPIRMKVVFLRTTNAGFEGTLLERIYDDYRKLAAGAVEPHEVRQALGREICGSKADAREVARIVLSRNLWRKADDQADTPEESCAATLGLPVHDPTRTLVVLATKKRKGFVVNEDWPSPEREAVMIGEPW